MTLMDQVFRYQHRTLGGAHLGIVRDEHVLDAVRPDMVVANSANGRQHSALAVAVQPRLRTKRIVADVDQARRAHGGLRSMKSPP